MKTYVPDYYPEFACKAGACRHTCCAGWEIDIDEDTCALYQQLPGELGERLRSVMQEAEDGTVSFCLTADERCPMLREDGLCEIICQHGEGALCQICDDHPRFRSFFTDRVEMGLGLCCEAAAELILQRENPAHWICLEDDGGEEQILPHERLLLAFRNRILCILQDRSLSVSDRLYLACEAVDAPLPVTSSRKVLGFLHTLEQLDPAWQTRLQRLETLAAISMARADAFSTEAEQLAVYMLMRHVSGTAEDERIRERVLFAVWATLLVSALSADKADFIEAARMFSAEIEYSEENLQAVLDWLGEESNGADGIL